MNTRHFILSTLDHAGAHIADDHLGARIIQASRQVEPHRTQTLHRDLQPGQRITAITAAHRCLNTGKRAIGSHWRRVATQLVGNRKSDDIFGFLCHRNHIVFGCTAILGGDVMAGHGLHGAAHGRHHRVGFDGERIADDHAFPAAQRQSRQCIFISHSARQAQHIANRIIFRRIGIKPASAQSRTDIAIMHADKGAQPGLIVMHHGNAFMLRIIGKAGQG